MCPTNPWISAGARNFKNMLSRRVWAVAVFSILCECVEDRLRWQTIELGQLLVHEMRIMDNGQNYVQKQHNRSNQNSGDWKAVGGNKAQFCSPAAILGREMAEEVTETSGSKICFSRPTCSPTQATGLEDRSSSLFVTSNYFPLENNILLLLQYCLEFKGIVQREVSSGSVSLDHSSTCHLLLNVCDMTSPLWSSVLRPHYWRAWLSICQVQRGVSQGYRLPFSSYLRSSHVRLPLILFFRWLVQEQLDHIFMQLCHLLYCEVCVNIFIIVFAYRMTRIW